MKCFRRRLFCGFSAISLLLLLTTVAVWILSYCRGLGADLYGIDIHWGDRSVGHEISACFGDISVHSFRNGRPTTLDHFNGHTQVAQLMVVSNWFGPGMSWTREVWVKRTSSVGAVLPGTYGTVTEIRLALYWPLFISLPLTVLIAQKGMRVLLNRRSGQLGVCKMRLRSPRYARPMPGVRSHTAQTINIQRNPLPNFPP